MVVAMRQQMFEAATAAVVQFIQRHPGYVLDNEQPAGVEHQLTGGGTNFVLWGHYQNEPVIYKFFHPDWGRARWRNERACLGHFAPTGLAPKIYAAVPERLIVMTCFPGQYISDEAMHGGLDTAARADLGRQLGEAAGRMVNLPLPEATDGYSIIHDYGVIPWDADLCEAVRFYLRLCRRDQHLFSGAVDPFYGESLALVERLVDRIPEQRPVIFHEDFHCYADNGRLQGFFDLEMARLGTELMQLERIFLQCAPEGLRWPDVMAGYEAQTGRRLGGPDYLFMLAMGLFYFHIRIARWGRPDTNADYVAEYLPDIRGVAARYAEYVDLQRWLPGL